MAKSLGVKATLIKVKSYKATIKANFNIISNFEKLHRKIDIVRSVGKTDKVTL